MQEGRSHHPKPSKRQEGALSVVARIVLLLNAPTIVRIKMMTRRARRRTKRRRRTR